MLAGTITSSPSPIPQILKFSSSAAVAELRHTVFSVSLTFTINADKYFSSGVRVITPTGNALVAKVSIVKDGSEKPEDDQLVLDLMNND